MGSRLVGPDFDEAKYRLGTLCLRKHEWWSTGKSLRKLPEGTSGGHCVLCVREDSFAHSKTSKGMMKRVSYYQENKKYLYQKSKERVNMNRARINTRRREWRKENPDTDKAHSKRAWAAIKADPARLARCREKHREWVSKNPKRVTELRLAFNAKLKIVDPKRYSARYNETRRRYAKANPHIMRLTRKRSQNKPENKFKHNLRTRLNESFRRFSRNGKKTSSKKYGVDFQKIIDHIGPCPGPRDQYHVDHIIPISLFDHDDVEQVLLAWAPKNHQWLTVTENRAKKNLLPEICPKGLERQYEVALANLSKG